MHCEFEEFLLILSLVPAFVFHHLAEFRKFVRIHVLRIAGIEFHSLLFRKVNDFRREFSRELAHPAQNHVPCVLVNGSPSWLSIENIEEVHEGGVLYVLAERCHQRRIAESWPYILDFIEKLHHEGVKADFRTSVSAL